MDFASAKSAPVLFAKGYVSAPGCCLLEAIGKDMFVFRGSVSVLAVFVGKVVSVLGLLALCLKTTGRRPGMEEAVERTQPHQSLNWCGIMSNPIILSTEWICSK